MCARAVFKRTAYIDYHISSFLSTVFLILFEFIFIFDALLYFSHFEIAAALRASQRQKNRNGHCEELSNEATPRARKAKPLQAFRARAFENII